VLDNLFAQALLASERRMERVSPDQLAVGIEKLAKPLDTLRILSPGPKIKLIAEIKRRSPSKGFLAEISDAGELAKQYEISGAHAISVLTEESGFGGSMKDLEKVRDCVRVPVLRKDFISTEYQILEARAAGADFVLLILAWLSPERFNTLHSFAESLEMAVLVETHNENEIETALSANAKLIGINTRDLETFVQDLSLYERMAQLLPKTVIRVAESSVKSVVDVQRYRSAGADVVLVGEALVTGNPEILIPQFTSVT
jgi:indole-3-glycerol phosphate synthase